MKDGRRAGGDDLHPGHALGREDLLQAVVEEARAAGLLEVAEVGQHRGRAAVVADEEAGQEAIRLDALPKGRDLGVGLRDLVGERRDLQRVGRAVDVLHPRRHERQDAARLDAGELLQLLGDPLHPAEDVGRVDGSRLGIKADHGHVLPAEQLLDPLAGDHQRMSRGDLRVDVQEDVKPGHGEAERQRHQRDQRDDELGPADDRGHIAAQHGQRFSSSERISGSRVSLLGAK